jgi:hypothetical protein
VPNIQRMINLVMEYIPLSEYLRTPTWKDHVFRNMCVCCETEIILFARNVGQNKNVPEDNVYNIEFRN